MKARIKVMAVLGTVALLFAVLLAFAGHEKAWGLWNVSTMTPHFADLRTITHGADSAAQGYDPLLENPSDPWQRRMNYPRIWQLLHALGIDQSHTTALGVLIIFSFLAGLCLILPNVENKTLVLVVLAILSPATLLGVERGNNDLLMFFFTALAILMVKRSALLASLAVLAAFSLKLFPIFAASILLRARQSTFIAHTIFIVIAVGIYTFFNYADIALIREATPKSTAVSYGMDVFWMRLGDQQPTLGFIAMLLSYAAIALCFLIALTALFNRHETQAKVTDEKYLDAFRAGATIYIGTFLVGNNWDYRLIFLIFTIPQLGLWASSAKRQIALLSKATLIVIFLSLWYLLITKYASPIPWGGTISYLADEAANWLVFAGLLYLFCWSLPVWVREAIIKKLPLYVNFRKTAR